MFTKILNINLERQPDRKKNIEEQLDSIDNTLPVERISAIDGNKLDIDNLSNKIVTPAGIKFALSTAIGLYTLLTIGAIGCAISHKIAWEKILKGNDEYVLILEDDIKFCNNFNYKLENIKNNIKSIKYDILFLGTHGYINNEELEFFDIPTKLYGLFGYIINKKAAKILLSIFPITEQIDTEMAKVFNKLNVYTVKYYKNTYIDDRIILSELSQESKTFGTDIQHRDYFSDNNSNYAPYNQYTKKFEMDNKIVHDKNIEKLKKIIFIIILGIIIYLYYRKK